MPDRYDPNSVLADADRDLEAEKYAVLSRAGQAEGLLALCASIQKIIVEARKKNLFDDKDYREALLNGIENKLKEALNHA